LRGGAKLATIQGMTENDATPETEDEPFLAEIAADDEAAASAEPDVVDGVAEAHVEASAEASADEQAPPPEDWAAGDIDAALAAVASLSDLMPEREAEAEARADARQSSPTFEPTMPMPPLTTLKRGQLGSVIPALLLIGLGAWLTLTTTSGTPPDPLLVATAAVGGLILTLLAQWLGTGRWSRGVLFFALIVLLFAGVVVFSVQPGGVDLGRGYPLLLVALGLALALAGFLARPLNLRMIAPGALFVLAGLTGLVITLGLIPGDWLALAYPLAPVVLVVALVMFLLPVIFRRRSSR
jgi:hypothetical protein